MLRSKPFYLPPSPSKAAIARTLRRVRVSGHQEAVFVRRNSVDDGNLHRVRVAANFQYPRVEHGIDVVPQAHTGEDARAGDTA